MNSVIDYSYIDNFRPFISQLFVDHWKFSIAFRNPISTNEREKKKDRNLSFSMHFHFTPFLNRWIETFCVMYTTFLCTSPRKLLRNKFPIICSILIYQRDKCFIFFSTPGSVIHCPQVPLQALCVIACPNIYNTVLF